MKSKMLYLTALLVTGSLFLLSCNKGDKNNPGSQLILLEGSGYLPMELGNYWKFSDQHEKLIDAVVTIDGNEYFRVISGDTTYLREDESGRIYERTNNTPEMLKFDLSAEVGQSWAY